MRLRIRRTLLRLTEDRTVSRTARMCVGGVAREAAVGSREAAQAVGPRGAAMGKDANSQACSTHCNGGRCSTEKSEPGSPREKRSLRRDA